MSNDEVSMMGWMTAEHHSLGCDSESPILLKVEEINPWNCLRSGICDQRARNGCRAGTPSSATLAAHCSPLSPARLTSFTPENIKPLLHRSVESVSHIDNQEFRRANAAEWLPPLLRSGGNRQRYSTMLTNNSCLTTAQCNGSQIRVDAPIYATSTERRVRSSLPLSLDIICRPGSGRQCVLGCTIVKERKGDPPVRPGGTSQHDRRGEAPTGGVNREVGASGDSTGRRIRGDKKIYGLRICRFTSGLPANGGPIDTRRMPPMGNGGDEARMSVASAAFEESERRCAESRDNRKGGGRRWWWTPGAGYWHRKKIARRKARDGRRSTRQMAILASTAATILSSARDMSRRRQLCHCGVAVDFPWEKCDCGKPEAKAANTRGRSVRGRFGRLG
ncbi:hypothetical protein B0H19DRAFT_1080121 [Mycena capillaripes]|nr:hypothetical protein B0H19DRAFT_1080121 [Mycena capillaripes]